MKPFLRSLTILLITTVALSARAEPTVLGRFGDWTAFRATEGSDLLCYIGSLPKKEEGNYKTRGRAYATVQIRPSESLEGVVTIEAGYPYKKDSRVGLVIDGKDRFELFTRNRKSDKKGDAWADNEADDQALVAAMKAGSEMVVTGRSSRGTLTTDTYSLSGFTRAYRAITDSCVR